MLIGLLHRLKGVKNLKKIFYCISTSTFCSGAS